MQINTLHKPGDKIGFMYQPRHGEPYQRVEKVSSVHTETYEDGSQHITYIVHVGMVIYYVAERDILPSTTKPQVTDSGSQTIQENKGEKVTYTPKQEFECWNRRCEWHTLGDEPYCLNTQAKSFNNCTGRIKEPERYRCDNKNCKYKAYVEGGFCLYRNDGYNSCSSKVILNNTVGYTLMGSPDLIDWVKEFNRDDPEDNVEQFCTNIVCASIRGNGTCSKSRDKYMCCASKDFLDKLNINGVDVEVNQDTIGKKHIFPNQPAHPFKWMCGYNRERVCDNCDPDCK